MLNKFRNRARNILNKVYLNYLKYKYSNFKSGNGTTIDFDSTIDIQKSELSIGNNTIIRSNPIRYHGGMPFKSCILIDVHEAKIKIGNNCRINGVYIHAQKEILIGDNCVIASGVQILDSNGHIVKSKDRTKERDIPETIQIKNNVWLGLNAIVLKGTLIEDNCVVSANSVVKGMFDKNSIIAGNPAIVVGTVNIEE